MGVQGLWKLLECAGRPVNPESLEGKILAVDISIWLNQAVKGVRDRQGNAMQNAHLLTLFHRLCKLLFFRIRPVFVFDGEAPVLKRQTLAKRRYKKNVAASEAKKTNDKLLRTFLKRQAIKAALSGNKQSNEEVPSLSQVRRKDEDDVYVLPPLEENEKNSSEEEEEREWEDRKNQKQMLQEEFFVNPHSVDIESEDFNSLPPEVKHEMLTDMKEFTKRRRTLFEAMPEDSGDFSQYQLQGLLKKNNLNKCINNVRKELNQQYSGEVRAQFETEGGFMKEVETQRLVSEDTSHYILIKGIKSKEEDKKEVSSTQSISSTYHDTTPKTYLDMKLASAHKRKITPPKSTEDAPPSPRTLFAIEEAMMENISEEELEELGMIDNNEKPSPSVSRVDSISPRTLQAIQQVLAEDEAGERGKKRAVAPLDEEFENEKSKEKVLIVSSSDDEENNLGPQGVNNSAPAISLASIEFSPSPTLIKKTFGNKPSMLNNQLSKKGESSNEGDTIKRDRVALPEQGIFTAKRNLFYDHDLSVPLPIISNLGDFSSDKLHAADPTASVMHSLVEKIDKPSTSGKSDMVTSIDPSKVSTTDTHTLHPCNKFVVQVETGREEHDLKPSTSLDTSYVTPPRVSELLLANRNKPTMSSFAAESKNLLLEVLNPPKNAELVEPKEESSNNIEVPGNNDANAVYIPMTPESLEDREEESDGNREMESDSDASFIEVESGDVINAQEPSAKEEVSSKCEEGSSGKETSFIEGEDVQPAELQGDEDLKDVDDTVKEWQDISLEELESLENNLFVEQTSLQAQKQQQERVAASVTGQMCLESQELLRLFGIPYLVAPMEAEAQCAILDLTDQTSGTITDDSDIWLFGARHVYKHFFSQNKYVEYYQYSDIHNQLGLDRSKLINLAYLLGSDYTDGIPTVGFVSAMEILNEFPGQGLESLIKFKEWWTDVQKNKKIRPNPNDTKVKKKLRDLELHPGFPNKAVADAYLKPVVDDSKGTFTWGRPDLEQIREFCESRFGWYRSKTDEVLLPVMKQLNSQQSQLRIDSFFRVEQHESQALKSQRLRRAVTCMKRKLKEGEAAEVEAAMEIMEKECTSRKQKKGGKANPKKCKGGKGKASKSLPEDETASAGGGFVEGNLKTMSPNKYSSDGSESETEEAKMKNNTKTSGVENDCNRKKPELFKSSSSSEDDETKAILVTAKPVFQGNKKKSRNVKGRKK